MAVIRALPAALLAAVLLLPTAGRAAGAYCSDLYDRGEYAEAAACFLGRVDGRGGSHDGHLFYNAGNALLRAGSVGEAVWAYRSAELSLPRDGDLAANLAEARDRARDDLAPPGARGALARTLLAPYDSLSRSELLLLGLIGWALALGCASWRLLRRNPAATALLVLAAFLAGFGLTGWAARGASLARSPRAVVLEPEVTLRSGRDVRSVDLLRLHEGAEVLVVEHADAWSQVALSTGARGWIPRDAVRVVDGRPVP